MFVVKVEPPMPKGTCMAFDNMRKAIDHADKMVADDSIEARIYSIDVSNLEDVKRAPAAIAGVQQELGKLEMVRFPKSADPELSMNKTRSAKKALRALGFDV